MLFVSVIFLAPLFDMYWTRELNFYKLILSCNKGIFSKRFLYLFLFDVISAGFSIFRIMTSPKFTTDKERLLLAQSLDLDNLLKATHKSEKEKKKDEKLEAKSKKYKLREIEGNSNIRKQMTLCKSVKEKREESKELK